MKFQLLILASCSAASLLSAGEPQNVWPDFAPGETSKLNGEAQEPRPGENPPITRVVGITQPTFTVHLPAKPNGAGVVILPGGGFIKVVPDKEGTEAAEWLNQNGFAAFVLSHRTKNDKSETGWEKALQDAQRTLSLIRSHSAEYGIEEDRIGLLGFSAGGQVAARLLSLQGKRSYERIDAIDDVSSIPNFGLLIYPWNCYDSISEGLVDGISVPDDCPPTFLVHTDDDRSSSLGAVLFYSDLKKLGIPSELHIYGNGGHGYGTRPVEGSEISSWTGHAAHWLKRFLKGQG